MSRAAHLDISYEDYMAQSAAIVRRYTPFAEDREVQGLYWLRQEALLDGPLPGAAGALVKRRKRAANNSTNPLVRGAAAILRGEQPAVPNSDALHDVLFAVTNYQPGSHLRKLISEAATMPQAAPAGPTHPLNPAGSGEDDRTALLRPAGHFAGHYPERPAGHTCRNGARVIAGGDGEAVTVVKMTAKLWRSRMAGGLHMARCTACYHDRVWRLCQQIEQEVMQYRPGKMALVWSTLSDRAAHKRAVSMFTTRRGRGHDVQFAAFPQHGGAVVLVHNQDDAIPGQPLPTDRAALYELMQQWADTPTGAEYSTSREWGGAFTGAKGDGRKKAGHGAEDETPAGAEDEQIELAVSSHAKLARAMAAAYDVQLTGRGRYGVSIVDVVLLCQAAGIDYGIVKGRGRLDELLKKAGVTQQVHKEKSLEDYVPVVSQPGRKQPKLLQSRPENGTQGPLNLPEIAPARGAGLWGAAW